ncbi:MAG TPA: hypothetical protein VF765_16665 [Polyangiaceae bacterium]
MRRAFSLLLLGLAACSSGSSASSEVAQPATVCDDTRAIDCKYFDVAAGAWSATPPSSVSLASACAPAGAHGEIDAYVTTSSSYRLDRVGFSATGTAVRAGSLAGNDDAGGTAFACGDRGAPVLTQLFCGKDVGTGTLDLRFTFSGRWMDGTPWTHQCDASVNVRP